ncbi:hypothetical protein [Microcystis aeruginosa]|uniref:hypothetical protein n=1 Tax=Microcystis aeruginosa TaxID=1126 RepID=UPI00124C5394|nr:hypothetical protein [Microcystis aeruginosa]
MIEIIEIDILTAGLEGDERQLEQILLKELRLSFGRELSRTVEASTRCAFFAESLEETNLITSYQEKEL